MAKPTDWAFEAALEIAARAYEGEILGRDVKAIINKWCPFKPDVAYMPVPRCETCAWWERSKIFSTHGECQYARTDDLDRKLWATAYDGVLTEADFGCTEWKVKS